jgi:hypothetical protein
MTRRRFGYRSFVGFHNEWIRGHVTSNAGGAQMNSGRASPLDRPQCGSAAANAYRRVISQPRSIGVGFPPRLQLPQLLHRVGHPCVLIPVIRIVGMVLPQVGAEYKHVLVRQHLAQIGDADRPTDRFHCRHSCSVDSQGLSIRWTGVSVCLHRSIVRQAAQHVDVVLHTKDCGALFETTSTPALSGHHRAHRQPSWSAESESA